MILCFITYCSLDSLSEVLGIKQILCLGLKSVFLGIAAYLFLSFFHNLPHGEIHPPKAISPISTFASLFYTNDSLLILRFFAAFCVFSTHAVILLHPDSLMGNKFIVGCAHSGMAIFFTLSGYLMGKAFIYKRYEFNQLGILKFYKNRFIRIAPLAFSVFIIYVTLMYPEKIKHNLLDMWRVFAFHFYGSGVYGLPGIGALWSLTVEMQYYLITPFIFYCFRDVLAKKKIAIFAIPLCVGLVYLNQHFHLTVLNSSPQFFSTLQGQLPYFLIGFALNYLIKDFISSPIKTWSKRYFYFQTFLLTLEFIIFFALLAYFQKIMYQWTLIGASLASCYFILRLEIFKFGAKDFSKKINFYTTLQSLGGLSYGFYLWHSGIGFVYYNSVKPTYSGMGDYILECTILAGITIFVSIWSYIFIERHFMRSR